MIFNKTKLENIKLDIKKFRGFMSDYKIMHLSDLHIAKYGAREKKLVKIVNRSQPDIILITGDLVNSYQSDFSASIETVQKLRTKYGVFVVFGNAEHTFRPIRYVHDFENALKEINVRTLNNESLELRLNGSALYLVGVDDPFFLFDRFDKAIEGVPYGAQTILLAHSPDILLPRADAIVVNLLDSEVKSDHFKRWGWEDSTSFGPENGDVYFESSGSHTIRVQSRQDGVSLDTIVFNPYEDIDRMLKDKNFEQIDRLLLNSDMHNRYPELITIPASSISSKKMFGKWKKKHDSSTLYNYRLDDLPPDKWYFQPQINPSNYFEADFKAECDTRYHVWIKMKAYNGSPFNDSVYLQFNDSVDKDGKKRYRIKEHAYSKERINDMDLILTGHTHGGQVRFPILGPVTTMSSMGKKYASGLHKIGSSLLYVSRGFGTSALPIRLFCPPEVTLFTFH